MPAAAFSREVLERILATGQGEVIKFKVRPTGAVTPEHAKVLLAACEKRSDLERFILETAQGSYDSMHRVIRTVGGR